MLPELADCEFEQWKFAADALDRCIEIVRVRGMRSKAGPNVPLGDAAGCGGLLCHE
jgi:hypothetical protein